MAWCGRWRWCRAVTVSGCSMPPGWSTCCSRLLLYGPGLLLFLYSRRQLGAEQRLSLRERLLAGITLVSLVPAIWSFAHV